GSTVNLAHGKRQLLGDLRGIPRTKYQCPAIEVEPRVKLDDVRRAAIEARCAGLVVARGEGNDLIVVPRNAGVAAIGIAQSLSGTLRTTTLGELRARALDAV